MEQGVKITKEKLTNVVLPLKGKVAIDKFTIDNGFMSVELINYGATITAIYLPDKCGIDGDLVLGFEDPLDYLKTRNPYFGATIGRYGNVISGAKFSIRGQVYYTSMNKPPDTYHGGIQGLDKKLWDAKVEDNALIMTLKSYDLDQGFPGDLNVKVKYILTPQNQLIILYTATANEITPVNITNECYFNLAGHVCNRFKQGLFPSAFSHGPTINKRSDLCTLPKRKLEGYTFVLLHFTQEAWENRNGFTWDDIPGEIQFAGESQLFEHEVKVNASYYVVTTEDGHPTGEVDEVERSFYDLRDLTSVKDVVECDEEFADEVSFCYTGDGLKNVAHLRHAESGRSLTVYSDQPGLTLKMGQNFKKIKGKEDAVYRQLGGICFQTGNLPDAVNQKLFPCSLLRPGTEYRHTIVWKFRVEGLTDLDEPMEPSPKDNAESDDSKSKTAFSTNEPTDGAKPEEPSTAPKPRHFVTEEVEERTVEETHVSTHDTSAKQ